HPLILGWLRLTQRQFRRFLQPMHPACPCGAQPPQRASHHSPIKASWPRQFLTMLRYLQQHYDSLESSCTPQYANHASHHSDPAFPFTTLGTPGPPKAPRPHPRTSVTLISENQQRGQILTFPEQRRQTS